MAKIRVNTMLGTNHSWSVTMRSLITEFIKLNNKLFIISTDGDKLIKDKWDEYLMECDSSPDIDISYTLPVNFRERFRRDSKLKLAIYNYETSIMPRAWTQHIKHIDYALPSSNFSKSVFVNSGWSEDKCIVVPHGINLSDFDNKRRYPLKTNKSFKFLNVSIPHYRKNIGLLLKAYYTAFSAKDDVCLVLKTNLKMPDNRSLYRFEVNLLRTISDIQKHFMAKGKQIPNIEIIQENIPDMVELYNACDVLVSSSSSEGFGLPLLEGLAANNLVIAPRATGQLDFLNDRNSLLVDVSEVNAGEEYQYWMPTAGAKTYMPEFDSLIESMLYAYTNHVRLKEEFENERVKTINHFTWENAAKKILEIR